MALAVTVGLDVAVAVYATVVVPYGVVVIVGVYATVVVPYGVALEVTVGLDVAAKTTCVLILHDISIANSILPLMATPPSVIGRDTASDIGLRSRMPCLCLSSSMFIACSVFRGVMVR